MFVVAVANSKGGCGKTTIATHLAARFARQGFVTTLLDLDRQGAAIEWVRRRSDRLPEIRAMSAEADDFTVPRGSPYVVIDVPAGPRRKELDAVIKAADLLVVPVQASLFDQDGTRYFLELAAECKQVRKGRMPIALVANRVRAKAVGNAQFEAFLAGLGHPVVTRLSDSPHYPNAARTGVTLFDQPEARVRARLAEWSPLLAMVNEVITSDRA